MSARNLKVLAGPLVFVVARLLPPLGGLGSEAWLVAALALWMAIWWLTVAVPLPVTALLPIVILPTFSSTPLAQVTRSYADPIIFLFLGGFLIAATLERWNLHRRFALGTIRTVGTRAPLVVLAFMLSAAFASMWISNTATAVMMLPIAKAICPTDSDGKTEGFSTALMLGVAYGASIGGAATLIGTPPNAILAGAARELLDVDVSFGSWLAVGLPVSIPMLAICWLVLVRTFRVSGRVEGLDDQMNRAASDLETPEPGDRFVVSVFALTALAWVFRAPKSIGPIEVPGLTDLVPGISDPVIALAAALILFVTPVSRSRFPTALDWETARGIPWGILLLFGGGLALAAAFESSGLTGWIGGLLENLASVPGWVVVVACSALFVFLTELTSNTATAALGMPVVAAVAVGLGQDPLTLMIVAALSASMAFMLPVATPPNAIVFGSGYIRPGQMARAGLVMNLAAITVVSLMVSWWRL